MKKKNGWVKNKSTKTNAEKWNYINKECRKYILTKNIKIITISILLFQTMILFMWTLTYDFHIIIFITFKNISSVRLY